MHRIILILILMLSLNCAAQEVMDFRYADSLTYSLYQQKNWDKLIDAAKEAINAGHDFYYMRMRIGIAYYELRNYALAAKHFRKALDFNSGDNVAIEYLFYTYNLSGRYYQAWSIISLLNSADEKRVADESGLRKNSVTAESFYLNTSVEDITSNPDMNFTNPESGSQVVTKSFINNAIYLSHITGKGSSYFHSFTNLIKHNYLHYYDGTEEVDLSDQQVVQNQYYGRLSFFTNSGWTFSPSFHILSTRYLLPAISYNGMYYTPYTYNYKTGGFAGGISITKTGGYITVSGEAIYSSLNKINNLQGTLSVYCYPLGNRSIYFGGNIAALHSLAANSQGTTLINGFFAGFSIKNRIWFEVNGTSGKMKNLSELNGLILYNGIDNPTSKYNAKITVPVYKAGISLFAGAGGGSHTSEFVPIDGFNITDANKLIYNNYNITGGLTWNF